MGPSTVAPFFEACKAQAPSPSRGYAQMEAIMRAAGFFISPQELWTLFALAQTPRIIDVRRREIMDVAPGVLPGASWCDPLGGDIWSETLDRHRPVILACKEGHERSQIAAAYLREQGFDASVLDGGYKAWSDAGLPLVAKAALDRFLPVRPSLWVTRRRPKIDRVACPWLIRRFIDPEARFLFVDPPEVARVAHETGAIPFDIDGVALSHEGERCSFDTILKLFGLENEPSLMRLALIVRGADTARLDHALLDHGFIVYDGLYAWLRFAAEERHNWPAKAA
jgi:rhodanese-related sulfurtransferase